VCIEQVVQDHIDSIGQNTNYTDSGDVTVFKCRVTDGTVGKSQGLRLLYMALGTSPIVIPLKVYKHGSTHDDFLQRPKTLKFALSVLKDFVKHVNSQSVTTPIKNPPNAQ